MAATYELDVSMALDGLEDHFGNWHNRALARETLEGLRTLGARQEAEIFARATTLAFRHWRSLASRPPRRGSALYKRFDPLNIKSGICSAIRASPVEVFWRSGPRMLARILNPSARAPNNALQRTRYARR